MWLVLYVRSVVFNAAMLIYLFVLTNFDQYSAAGMVITTKFLCVIFVSEMTYNVLMGMLNPTH